MDRCRLYLSSSSNIKLHVTEQRIFLTHSLSHTLLYSLTQTHRANKHNQIPETKNIESGSSRRNITRRHDIDPHGIKKDKKQGGGGIGGKGNWNKLDDGSL
jgi:hypothetical protein